MRQSKHIQRGGHCRVCRGQGCVPGCDTCRLCQDQEERVGMKKGQRWSGKPDPFSRPATSVQDLASPQGAASPRTIPCEATTPPTLPRASYLHSCFDSQPRQTKKPAGSFSPRSHLDSVQGHSIGLDDLDLRRHTKRPIQRQLRTLDAGRAFCWTLGLNTQEKEKSQRARRIASNQPSDINTSCDLPNKEGTCQVDGTSNRAVMGKDTCN